MEHGASTARKGAVRAIATGRSGRMFPGSGTLGRGVNTAAQHISPRAAGLGGDGGGVPGGERAGGGRGGAVLGRLEGSTGWGGSVSRLGVWGIRPDRCRGGRRRRASPGSLRARPPRRARSPASRCRGGVGGPLRPEPDVADLAQAGAPRPTPRRGAVARSQGGPPSSAERTAFGWSPPGPPSAGFFLPLARPERFERASALMAARGGPPPPPRIRGAPASRCAVPGGLPAGRVRADDAGTPGSDRVVHSSLAAGARQRGGEGG
ncbi:unnamed protein product [Dicrocoelium dendriticum]|nr:unnamed protein product [Dicrocoelium dendriticum]